MRVGAEEETLATSEGEGVSDYEGNKHMNGASLVRGERAKKHGVSHWSKRGK
jgi:hypothetical protein